MAVSTVVSPVQSRIAVLVLVAASVTLTSPPAPAATVFTDRAAWENAVAATVITDTFSNNIAKAPEITLDSGIISTYVGSNPVLYLVSNEVSGNNVTGNGSYHGWVNSETTLVSKRSIAWTFPNPVTAFGADINLSLSSLDPGRLRITGDFDGTGAVTVNIDEFITKGDGFFGVVGDSAFSNIIWDGALTGTSYHVDDFSFAVVPIPAADVLSDAETIFDWAEDNFPQFFPPPGATTQVFDPWLYRYYPVINVYAGVNTSSEVWVLGNVFGGLVYVTTVEELLDTINQLPITITSPNGGEKLIRGTTHWIEWNSQGETTGSRVNIYLYKSGKLHKTIAEKTLNDGEYLFEVSSTIGTAYKIKVVSVSQPSLYDYSNRSFSIVDEEECCEPTPPPDEECLPCPCGQRLVLITIPISNQNKFVCQ